VSSPSDAPVRAAGTRTRSGNAMLRTRSAILDATGRCVARSGVRKMTMSDVSTSARIAKATLYNHFRTKDDLLAALVQSRVDQLTAECSELAGAGLGPALLHAGRWLGECAPLRRIATEEPALIAALATPSNGRLWDLVRAGVVDVLRESGAPSDPVAVDVVLRWLCGHVVWPASPDELARGAPLLADGLGRAPEPVAAPEPEPVVDVRGTPERAPAPAGVGWPI
jgi:AcrR family transcriptional regulator